MSPLCASGLGGLSVSGVLVDISSLSLALGTGPRERVEAEGGGVVGEG